MTTRQRIIIFLLNNATINGNFDVKTIAAKLQINVVTVQHEMETIR